MPTRAKLMVSISVLVLVIGALFGVARMTDYDWFCKVACHEMRPYHQAWEQGAHKQVQCVECHVDQGVLARLMHKGVALRELKVHVFGEPAFPMRRTSEIPDKRCIRCHKEVNSSDPSFSHEDHAGRGSCEWCHTTAAHTVTPASLRAEGVYSGLAISSSAQLSERAAPNKGVANVVGHQDIGCTRCHDMQKTGCARCHTLPDKHEFQGDCIDCHTLEGKFAFVHPKAKSCSNCHKAPQDKHDYGGGCSTCHKGAGKSWKFTHPKAGGCKTCHVAPKKHFDQSCGICHKRVGTSWAFSHPSGSTCSSCHQPPRGHYGGSCSRCHSPSRSWANASFSHPRIRGGEHMYRSFACSKCHPNGYSSSTCSKCHDSSSGPNEDDDEDEHEDEDDD